MGAQEPAGRTGALQPQSAPSPEQADRSIAAAAKYLLSRMGPDGRTVDEYPAGQANHGGKTALCVYTLLSAGFPPDQHPQIAKAVTWLSQANLTGVGPIALRACCLAIMPETPHEALQKDIDWLIRAADAGAYSYVPPAGQDRVFDNFNSQLAATAVRLGELAGADIQPAYWQIVQKHWLAQQQADGGWCYRVVSGCKPASSYGSMTAAGACVLYTCMNRLTSGPFIRCDPSDAYQPIEKALAWLDANFQADGNPGRPAEWFYCYLDALSRAAAESGRRQFAGKDWQRACSARLIREQHADGSFGQADATVETAYALLFLARGTSPMLMSKLQYAGSWNARPRDAANLTHWIFQRFERQAGWQIVDQRTPLEFWQDSPILYISGAGRIDLDDSQIAMIRAFVNRGGMILSEAACNSAQFTLDIRQLYQRLFGKYEIERLAATDPAFTAQFKLAQPPQLVCVSNGIRPLAIHSPAELSLALQLGPTQSNLSAFELFGNLYVYVTDKGTLLRRGRNAFPEMPKFEPTAKLAVARVKYDGNWDPEPLAWRRLSAMLAGAAKIAIDGPADLEADQLDPAKYKLAHLTGTAAAGLKQADFDGLKKYIQGGGTLLIDAAGSSSAFAGYVEEKLIPALGLTRAALPADHPIYTAGPFLLDRIRLRRATAIAPGNKPTGPPSLQACFIADRPAVIYSPADLTAGMLGYRLMTLTGYSSQSACEIVMNLIYNLSALPPVKHAATQPATEPANK
ncbi:MAG: DUF4159 domain-containing protein [Planctomycetes bacterium]|nr:DUF4159 domain-containing protein [Planctomycetota bacterium]